MAGSQPSKSRFDESFHEYRSGKREFRFGIMFALVCTAAVYNKRTKPDLSMNPPTSRKHGDAEGLSFESKRDELLSDAPIPMLWLLGKTGSGKSSIVRYLTGADQAEIGNGFRPETRFSKLYNFPDDEVPVARFLDTRGLGEANYDAKEDLEKFNDESHLIIVTIRVTDQAVDKVIESLKTIRKANSHRSVLLVLTALHDAYPGEQHAQRVPLLNPGELSDEIRSDLKLAIDVQRDRFSGLYDRAVAIDLTPEDEGFDQAEYGGAQLKAAIIEMLPAAYRQTLIQMDQLTQSYKKAHRDRCAPIILAHSVLATSAAAVPIPWIDIPIVIGIQTRLAHRLAKLNNQSLDSQTLARVSAAVGGRVAVQMGVREALKFVPWVGIAVNVAATFALTYASGWAWNWYFMQVNQGHIPTTEELREVYKQQLKRGEKFWKASKENHFE